MSLQSFGFFGFLLVVAAVYLNLPQQKTSFLKKKNPKKKKNTAAKYRLLMVSYLLPPIIVNVSIIIPPPAAFVQYFPQFLRNILCFLPNYFPSFRFARISFNSSTENL